MSSVPESGVCTETPNESVTAPVFPGPIGTTEPDSDSTAYCSLTMMFSATTFTVASVRLVR